MLTTAARRVLTMIARRDSSPCSSSFHYYRSTQRGAGGPFKLALLDKHDSLRFSSMATKIRGHEEEGKSENEEGKQESRWVSDDAGAVKSEKKKTKSSMEEKFRNVIYSRSEMDALGEKQIPKEALYGIATQRAIENYKISAVKLSDFPELVKALALVKKASAKANFEVGLINHEIYQAIYQACDLIIVSTTYHAHFAAPCIQGGAGTATNMNANEVISNLANEKYFNKPLGTYSPIHPNDHVNLGQSTNDAYPTAAKLAVSLHNKVMVQELEKLIHSFRKKGEEFNHILKVGRTQLQDAVPMTVGQEFSAFAHSLESDLNYLSKNMYALYEVNLGGTAIGTSICTHEDFSKKAIDALKEFTNLPFHGAKDLVEASSSTSAFLLFSSILRRIALKTSKICNDLRLLSSGPMCGLNELNLPAVAPGSSIMPGKINPVVPETVNQVCFQVIGADAAISLASEHAQLQLNAFEPLIVYNLLSNLNSMANGFEILREKCIDGITVNEEVCKKNVEDSIGVVTALLPTVGYKKATDIAKRALQEKKPVSEVAVEMVDFFTSEEDVKKHLDVESMTGKTRRRQKQTPSNRKFWTYHPPATFKESQKQRPVTKKKTGASSSSVRELWSYQFPPKYNSEIC